jgi:formiminotetrahydrofolate cyclodeaminase
VAEIQSKLRGATEVPLQTAESATRVLSLAKSLSHFCNENAFSDLETAVFLAHASSLGALSNVAINLAGIRDEEYQKRIRSRLEAIQKQIEQDKSAAIATIASRTKH